MIGEPLWVDAYTSSWGRSSYAHVCVRLNLAGKLEPGVMINGLKGQFFQAVEYEGITVLCFQCGKIGHKDINCPMGNLHRADYKGKAPMPPQGRPRQGIGQNHTGVRSERQPAPEEQEGLQEVREKPGNVNGTVAPTRMNLKAGVAGDLSLGEADGNEGLGPWTFVQRWRRPHVKGKPNQTVGKVQEKIIPKTGRSKASGHHSDPVRTAPLREREIEVAVNPPSVEMGKSNAPPIVSQALVILDKPLAGRGVRTRDRNTKAAVGKELLRLGPAPTLPKKRRKNSIDCTDGGDTSPLVE